MHMVYRNTRRETIHIHKINIIFLKSTTKDHLKSYGPKGNGGRVYVNQLHKQAFIFQLLASPKVAQPKLRLLRPLPSHFPKDLPCLTEDSVSAKTWAICLSFSFPTSLLEQTGVAFTFSLVHLFCYRYLFWLKACGGWREIFFFSLKDICWKVTRTLAKLDNTFQWAQHLRNGDQGTNVHS